MTIAEVQIGSHPMITFALMEGSLFSMPFLNVAEGRIILSKSSASNLRKNKTITLYDLSIREQNHLTRNAKISQLYRFVRCMLLRRCRFRVFAFSRLRQPPFQDCYGLTIIFSSYGPHRSPQNFSQKDASHPSCP